MRTRIYSEVTVRLVTSDHPDTLSLFSCRAEGWHPVRSSRGPCASRTLASRSSTQSSGSLPAQEHHRETAMDSSVMRGVVATALCCLLASVSAATTHYNVRLNTTERVGLRADMAFDLTSSNDSADSLEIFNFAHDGRARPGVMLGLTY